MKRLIPLSIVLLFVWSCEQLAEEDTPVCKYCFELHYDKETGEFVDTVWPYVTKKLCGGDVITFEQLDDAETDSTTYKHKCVY